VEVGAVVLLLSSLHATAKLLNAAAATTEVSRRVR
jgi:hypothetical protein